MGSLAPEARAYGQSRSVSPFSCAYLATDAASLPTPRLGRDAQRKQSAPPVREAGYRWPSRGLGETYSLCSIP
jgi:hypothetical protein